MKTAVSIPDPLFTAADELAERLGFSRSKLYAVALKRFVHEHNGDAITAKLDEIYASEPSTLDPVLGCIQARSITKSRWK